MLGTTRTTPITRRGLVALALALALVVGGLSGCAKTATPKSAQTAATTFPITLTDDAGRKVTIAARPKRIVSLAPANTEIVAALGGIDRLVGVTTLCDYPAEVKKIAKVGDFMQPNLEVIASLKPDLVLVTTGV